MDRLGLVVEFWYFFRHRKTWWLIPVVLTLLLVAFLAVAGEATALAPLIYPLF